MTQVARAVKADTEIQKDVLRELKWDGRVDETDVGVEVDEGVVTLTGTVTSWGKRLAAAKAAHKVFGVRDVANDIVVKVPGSPGRTDTEIAQAVRHALEWDVFVPDKNITSTVSNGSVTLEGEVTTWSQRDAAGRAVRDLSGVREVLNEIRVTPPRVEPAVVRKAIEGALARRAERQAGRVWFEVEDGVVKVHGAVGSWAEKEAVVGAAKGTPGVRMVEDLVRIELD
jgi:osmotically-inducible protein OsmY